MMTIIIIIEMTDYLTQENHSVIMTSSTECVRSFCRRNLHKNRVQSPKEYFTPPTWRRFFVYSSNMAAVTSCEHTLYWSFIAKVDELGGGTALGAREFWLCQATGELWRAKQKQLVISTVTSIIIYKQSCVVRMVNGLTQGSWRHKICNKICQCNKGFMP